MDAVENRALRKFRKSSLATPSQQRVHPCPHCNRLLWARIELIRLLGPTTSESMILNDTHRHRWTNTGKGSLGLGKNMSSTRTHVLHDDGMKVFIHICAESEIAIQNAIHDVEEKCSKELEIDSITDEGIKRLSDDQISEIEKIGQKHNVKLTLEKRIGRVRIEGIVTDVARGKTEVLSLLREIERSDFKEKQSTMLLQLVQWRFLESTDESQEWLDYDKNTNAKIEEAYQRKDKVLKLPGGIIIDFEALEQYPEIDPTVKLTVLRKDKIKDLVSEMPPQWDPMDKDNLRLIHLQSTSTEYSGVAQRFMTSIHKGNKHPNVQVLKIERIQNKTLYSQYQSKRKLIDEMNPGQKNEMDLWHGTAGQAVNSINVHGFNRSFCGKNATLYGDGVYFAKEAYYSAREVYSPPDAAGNKRMYLTKVLTGKYDIGAQGMRVPPPLISGQPELHDSVVDDVNKPFIFVIFHDTQAYPEYLITFKLN
ncbi:hypothetical protein CHS0354_006395 [Potamilus streckersoni]|uniref:Poly [ADP-ribose] polymerase n=1 Tax=Potamilus streckersoni TaxID=2493646 RepID=A0AAE0T937_9BIVA|nr:hypothetical protein CHS0354_006395 [Potamilus streckersoni]